MATLESTTESVVRKVGVKGFEHYQQLIVYCLMKKQDCVGILPTRYGKSPPYLFLWRHHLIFSGHGRRHFEFLNRLKACLFLNVTKYTDTMVAYN